MTVDVKTAKEIIERFSDDKSVALYIRDEQNAILSKMRECIVRTIIDALEDLYEEDFSNRYAIIDHTDRNSFKSNMQEEYIYGYYGVDEVMDMLTDTERNSFKKALCVADDTRFKLYTSCEEIADKFLTYVFQLLADFEAQLIFSANTAEKAYADFVEEKVYVFDVVRAKRSADWELGTILFRIKDGYREMVHLLTQCFAQFAYDKLNDYYEEDELK